MILDLPQPYHPEWSLSALQTSSFGAPYRFLVPNRVRRLVQLEGRTLLVEFAFHGTRLHVQTIPALPDDDESLLHLARHVWSLEDDLKACYSVLETDPVLAPLLSRYHGYRIVRVPTIYEALIVAVVGQLISVTAAHAIRERLMRGLGEGLAVEGEEYLTYPTPAQLLAVSPERLQGFGLTRQKALCLQAVARHAEAGDLENTLFEDLSNAEAITRLTAIPGIGRWTADVALLFGLGRSDIFLAGDVALAAAIQRAFDLSERPKEKELRSLAKRWEPWQSYAVAYLMIAHRKESA